ncbi:30S ribosomal protein S15 [Endomicrobium proavitum]|uniref:Small ribosomal subunit protein uS15 n=1 Tax=Endomicrobium proavitum TaxID=1408281 RepID=A0A0G3WH64_9BACT|nr:30S ribosomal protein S15 [Endomicrobium proavitum]AKL97961.1 30S ribosomal subunit protein S15 [Endomicrobium proavitum]
MALVKKEVVEQFKTHATDTGSPEVQVALLTSRIKYLSDHFQKFPKDFASRVGFLKMIGQRRRLLDYIKKHDKDGYATLIKKLDLRK